MPAGGATPPGSDTMTGTLVVRAELQHVFVLSAVQGPDRLTVNASPMLYVYVSPEGTVGAVITVGGAQQSMFNVNENAFVCVVKSLSCSCPSTCMLKTPY